MTEPEKELSERNFIQNTPNKDPYAMLYWMGVLFALLLLVWGIGSWYHKFTTRQREETPFLQVTNRNFALFLWDNPEFMRINASTKRGYLPAFDEGDELLLNPELAEEYVVAPPEVIFRYHVWNRLLSSYSFNMPIKPALFTEFLKNAPEWDPKNWPAATSQYTKLVNSLGSNTARDLQSTDNESLPIIVRRAYWGWSSYNKNGPRLNALKVDYGKLYTFLTEYPRYQRSYWRNILLNSYPQYLEITMGGSPSASEMIPSNQITPFLRVALFNASER